MQTRTSLAISVLLVVLVAGCTSAVTDDSLSFAASKATVAESTLADTGFEVMRSESPTFERTFDVQGSSYRVQLNSHVTYYRADYRGAPLAFAAVLSTPQASAMGRSLNPVSHVGGSDLVERALSAVSDVETAKRVGRHRVRILGQQVDVEEYRATNGSGGANARVMLARIEHDGDYVVAAASYPADLEHGQRDVLGLFRGITH